MNRKPFRLRSWLGVNGPALGDTPADADAAFAVINATGARWVRLDFDWPSLAEGGTRYERALELTRQAKAQALDVLATIGYRPGYVEAIDPTSKATNPWQLTPTATGAARVGEIRPQIEALIAAGVDAVEGWNEWNLDGFSHPPDAAAMAVYHAALADAVASAAWRAGNRTVPVIVGGTAPSAYHAHDAYEHMLGVGSVYAAMGRVGDYPAHHPYAFGYDPYAAAHRGKDYNALTFQPAAIIWNWAAAGRPSTRVWATEIGWPDSIGRAEQARRAETDLREWARMIVAGIGGPVFVYTARSDRLTGVDGEAFGLIDRNGNVKQHLVDAIRRAGTAVIQGATL